MSYPKCSLAKGYTLQQQLKCSISTTDFRTSACNLVENFFRKRHGTFRTLANSNTIYDFLVYIQQLYIQWQLLLFHDMEMAKSYGCF